MKFALTETQKTGFLVLRPKLCDNGTYCICSKLRLRQAYSSCSLKSQPCSHKLWQIKFFHLVRNNNLGMAHNIHALICHIQIVFSSFSED